MIRHATYARLRSWLAPRTVHYQQVIVALALNVPFIVATLSRYPQDLKWASVSGAYALLVFIGYYVLGLFLLLTSAFLLTGAWRRVFVGVSTGILTFSLFYFAVDGVVYRVAKMHVDAFWLSYLVTTFDGLGIGFGQIASAIFLLTLIVLLELFLLRRARVIAHRVRWSAGLVAVSIVCCAITQVIHAAAFEVNDTRFTSITPRLPFYFPLTSHSNALKYGSHLSMIKELEADGPENAGESLRYPLNDVGCAPRADRTRKNVLVLLLESWRADAMDSVVAPQMYAFAREASYFRQHFSSGNSTRAGVFPLFYGIHSTYWRAVQANNARIHNPVLIDALQDNGYALGIFAKSNFKTHKIKDAVFRDIDVEESFAGKTADANDRDMTTRMFAFMAAQQAADTPFFSFAFYKSTHYPYEYPADSAPFQPTAELSVLGATARDDPRPVLNDYRNAVHYTDGLIGDLLRRMRAAGMLENTMVIITGDHGEQFNDTGDNSWLHGGNFTRYLTSVPLIVYAPGRAGRRVSTVTSEVDIAPTILQEGLECGWNNRDYSNGFNLFGALPERRPIVVASYVNHALIVDRNVFVTAPMYVQRYDLDGAKVSAEWPDAKMMQWALDDMTRFYGATRPSLTASRSPQP